MYNHMQVVIYVYYIIYSTNAHWPNACMWDIHKWRRRIYIV